MGAPCAGAGVRVLGRVCGGEVKGQEPGLKLVLDLVHGKLAQEGGPVRGARGELGLGGGKVEHLVGVGVEEGVLGVLYEGEEEPGRAEPGGVVVVGIGGICAGDLDRFAYSEEGLPHREARVGGEDGERVGEVLCHLEWFERLDLS